MNVDYSDHCTVQLLDMSSPAKLIDSNVTLHEALASRQQKNKKSSRKHKVSFDPVVKVHELEETSWTYWKSIGLTFRPSSMPFMNIRVE